MRRTLKRTALAAASLAGVLAAWVAAKADKSRARKVTPGNLGA